MITEYDIDAKVEELIDASDMLFVALHEIPVNANSEVKALKAKTEELSKMLDTVLDEG